MDAQSIDQLLNDAKAREDEVRKDREALERVRAMMARVSVANGSNLSPKKRIRSSPVAETAPSSLSAAIREAVAKSGSTFTSSSLRAYIEATYPEMKISQRLGTLSSVLSKMSSDGKIKITDSPDRPGKAMTYLKLTETLL